MRTRAFYRAGLVLVALAGLAVLDGCVIRRTRPARVTATVAAPAPTATVVAQPRPVVVATPPPVATAPPVVTATTIAPTGGVANGTISYSSQRVRFPLAISYPRTVSIYVDGHGLDPTVAVYDGYGSRIGFNDDGGSGLDSNLVLTLGPGNYVVEVAGYGSSTGPFTLTVN